MTTLFALTLFVAASLLFVVQPMAAKMVLPLLGGSPAVWNTCMAFFQAALLAGYGYAHASARWLGIRGQSLLHLGLLLLSAWFLPFDVGTTAPSSEGQPVLWLLGLLLATLGAPIFVVAATAPMLQGWFFGTRHPSARDPYFLYGASNLGSLLALLAYPFVIEPNVSLATQRTLWAVGYTLLAALTVVCALAVGMAPSQVYEYREFGHDDSSNIRVRLRWAALAFVPSSWMLGVTTYLSTDVAPAPLLWVVPLSLYLLTFVLAFARRPVVPHAWVVRALPWLVVPLALVLGFGLVQPFWIVLHLLAFFVAALACHGELASSRPPARDLTAFYLALALGGVLGGVFNALVAPVVFNRLAEYPLAVILACLLVPGSTGAGSRLRAGDVIVPLVIFGLSAALVRDLGGWSETLLGVMGTILASGLVVYVCVTRSRRPIRFALGIGAALVASGLAEGVDGRVLRRERSFFGVLKVTEVADGTFHRLFLGTTLHGQQSLDRSRRREPLTYFHRTGPVGQVFEAFGPRWSQSRVAVIGLGAGSLAAYATPGQRWDFYEIDPAVARVARDPRYFTYLRDAHARSLDVLLGDARLRLREAPDRGYEVIVFDAFSSDAVPTHLLTREALELYRAKLAEGGLLVFDITNRYLDLEAVVGALARDAGWVCRVRYDLRLTNEQQHEGKQPSIWAVMAAREADLSPLADDHRWMPARVRDDAQVWTDDFTDIVRHLVWSSRLPMRHAQ